MSQLMYGSRTIKYISGKKRRGLLRFGLKRREQGANSRASEHGDQVEVWLGGYFRLISTAKKNAPNRKQTRRSTSALLACH